jgi:hypothetical protein
MASDSLEALQVVLEVLQPLVADDRPAVRSLASAVMVHLYKQRKGKNDPGRAAIGKLLHDELKKATAVFLEGDRECRQRDAERHKENERRLAALEKTLQP